MCVIWAAACGDDVSLHQRRKERRVFNFTILNWRCSWYRHINRCQSQVRCGFLFAAAESRSVGGGATITYTNIVLTIYTHTHTKTHTDRQTGAAGSLTRRSVVWFQSPPFKCKSIGRTLNLRLPLTAVHECVCEWTDGIEGYRCTSVPAALENYRGHVHHTSVCA